MPTPSDKRLYALAKKDVLTKHSRASSDIKTDKINQLYRRMFKRRYGTGNPYIVSIPSIGFSKPKAKSNVQMIRVPRQKYKPPPPAPPPQQQPRPRFYGIHRSGQLED